MNKVLAALFSLTPILILYYILAMSVNGSLPFPIKRGEDFRVTVGRLKREGIIHSSDRFILLARMLGLDRKARYGYYTFRKHLPEFKVLLKLTVQGAPLKEFTVRVPEGYTLKKMAPLFARIGIEPDTFLHYVNDSVFIKTARKCCPLMDTPPLLEGYLYPDTYKFVYGESVYDVVCKMLKRMCKVFDSSTVKRMRDINFTMHDVLTLASIIEKEAMVDSERPIISGVFHNRLKKGIPLAANPTLNYVLGENYGWLPGWALKNQSPYNTYIYPGLPPGPICAPSEKSIIAAIWPKKVRYLYFVARGDGTHLFARSYARHRQNIRFVKHILFRKNSKPFSGIVKSSKKVHNETKAKDNKSSIKNTAIK